MTTGLASARAASNTRAQTTETTSLRVTEVFRSLQGEGRYSGIPTCFLRLTGCPLRCAWCDTAYAFEGGTRRSIRELLEAVRDSGCRHVCVTGGEPLAQPACHTLLSRLCDAGYQVSLETSGALDFSGVDARVCRVVDIKPPGSGEAHRQRWDLMGCLTEKDQIKAVIASRDDYDWVVAQLRERALHAHCEVLLSPVSPGMPPEQLADWIVADALPVRFQIQLHKLLWGNTPGR